METGLGLLFVSFAVAAIPQRLPVVIVVDPAEIEHISGVQVQSTFALTAAEAKLPRQALPRYLEDEVRREKSKDRRSHLRKIATNADRYVWHCGGYVRGGEKYQFCT